MKVSVISESEFTVQGHGVHTAYVELTNALRTQPNVEVTVNKGGVSDITHFHTVGLYALRRLLFDSSIKVVSAHIVPGSLKGSLVGANLWLPLAKVYLRWFYNRADLLFAVSDATKRELEHMGVRKPIEIVYNMVDTTKYETSAADKVAARKRLHIADDAWVVVGAGQVQPRKRVDDMVRVAKLVPDMTFIWVGGMPFGKLAAENKAMQTMMDSAPKNVVFTGQVDHTSVKLYYQAADVFWLPSEQETFGLVVVEAAAVGLPVVLRDIPDYKETFASDAILTDSMTTDDTLKRLRDDKEYYARSVKASARLANRYDAKAAGSRVVDIYKRLIRSYM